MTKKNMTHEIKRERLLRLYTMEEICEIIGWNDESNPDVANPEMEELQDKDYTAWERKIQDIAIINGNFEESIEKNERFGL